ncbi:unnamed protein product, partial [Staurois parvus]
SGNRQQPTTGQGPRATDSNLPLGRGLGQQTATYHWAGASGNRQQPTTGQGPRATDSNLPLGRGLGQQTATYHWAGASGNRQQPSTGQGPRGLNGTLVVEAGHSTAPTQLSRVTGLTGTQQVAMAQALRGTTGHGWSVHTQRGGSEHGWSVHTSGTVQDTGGQCTQQEQ